MKKLVLLAIILVVVATVCSCHHTHRQVHKTMDGIHDVFLEGS